MLPETASLKAQMTEFEQPAWLRDLPRKLAHIQSLWQKLLYVRWDLQALGLMHRLVQEIRDVARTNDAGSVLTLVLTLQQQLETLQSRQAPPPEADRGRINGTLQRIARGILALQATHPRAASDEAEIKAAFVESIPPENPATRHLYLLESDPHQADLLTLRLSHRGYAVRSFAVLDALRAAMQRRMPDLLLANVAVSEGDLAGVEAVDALRSEFGSDFPILFLSARGDLAARLAAVRAGGQGYFLKPLDFDEVVHRVDELLPSRAVAHKVLIIEDEEQLASAYGLVLQHAGFVSQVLSRPLQVLQVLQEFQPDLVLMDLHLPECTGIELMQLIRQDPAYYAMPILFLSSDSDPAKHNAALSQGADLFLLKPIKPDQLVAAVSSRAGRARALRQRMRFLTQQDPLTGLLNQRAFLGYLDRHIKEIQGRKRSAVLLYVEVDQYRGLRDRLGISIADLLLADLAARVRGCLNQASRLARLSEGSFCALLDTEVSEAHEAAEALCDKVAASVFSAEQESVTMTLSVGVAPLDPSHTLGQAWLSSAALACDIARDAGGNRIALHPSAVDDFAARSQHARCAALLREALANDEFHCAFQPIASLGGQPVERYDVLLRARDPEGREIPAARLFDVARAEGIATALDRWVIVHVATLLQQRAEAGAKTVFFLKLSAETLNDQAFGDWLAETLATHGVAARQFVFEFAESDVAVSVRAAGQLFERLQVLGCRTAVEHFGASLSSAQLLSHLPVDYVKIDSAFVHDLVHRPANRDGVREILRQADAAGAMVIASFVEDASSLAVLWQCGVHFIQGNFLQAPDESLSFDFSDALNP